jgi:hypothetical protein
MRDKYARLLPLLLTVAVVAAVAGWAWFGLKQPPLYEGRGIITTPAGWQLLTAGPFTFYAPKGSVVRQAEKSGLVYGDVLGPNVCLNYRIGPKTALVADKRSHASYTETATAVSGHAGVMRKAVLNDAERAKWFSQCNGTLYIGLLVSNALADGSTIAMEGTALSEDERDQVETIFKSMRITP